MKGKREKKFDYFDYNYYYDLAIRMAIAILLSIGPLAIFYFVFTPLTIGASYLLLKLFYPIILQENAIIYKEFSVVLINACIAGSAYYLLALLNLTTKGISVITRIKAFLFGAFSFLVLNVLRIVILMALLFKGSSLIFDQVHIAFWVIGSTLFVVLIWLLTIKIYNIKEIPVYSDVREVLRLFEVPRRRGR